MIPIGCPREAGLLGRRDGARMYRPERSQPQAGREALIFRDRRGASEPTRRTYLFAHQQGWLAAAAEAAQKAKEQS